MRCFHWLPTKGSSILRQLNVEVCIETLGRGAWHQRSRNGLDALLSWISQVIAPVGSFFSALFALFPVELF